MVAPTLYKSTDTSAPVLTGTSSGFPCYAGTALVLARGTFSIWVES